MTAEQLAPSTEDFAAMLDEVFGENERFDGKVVTGTIIALDKEAATIDIGLKAEGRVLLKEFASPGQDSELAVGDKVDIFVERIENATGEAILSREKARREESWTVLEKSYADEERVDGVIFGRVKGDEYFNICPDADVKIFITADVETRAKRRFLEQYGEGGNEGEFQAILADLTQRDQRDINRTSAPLKAAENAHLLDTSNSDIEAVFEQALQLISNRMTIA